MRELKIFVLVLASQWVGQGELGEKTKSVVSKISSTLKQIFSLPTKYEHYSHFLMLIYTTGLYTCCGWW